MSPENIPEIKSPNRKSLTMHRIAAAVGLVFTAGVTAAAIRQGIIESPVQDRSLDTAPTPGISSMTDIFPPPIPYSLPRTADVPVPTQRETHLPHESVVEHNVLGPLKQAIRDRLDTPGMLVTNDITPGRSVYEFTYKTKTRMVTLVTGAAGDAHTFDPNSDMNVQATYIELGTGVRSSDNPGGNQLIAQVDAFNALSYGNDHFEANGTTEDGEFFNTQPDQYNSQPLTQQAARIDLDTAQQAVHATTTILKALPPARR
jgi:hypothetical protein